MKKLVLLTLLLVFATVGNAQELLLAEDFTLNTANVSSQKPKNLGSGEWLFYYTDQSNGSSIKQCAMLKYSGSNMGYIITPSLSKPATLVFDARTKTLNKNNNVEIWKSVNGGEFILVENVLVSTTLDKYSTYTVIINETNDNVKLKFLRAKPKSDGDGYHIIIDNVEVWSAPESEPEPVLQVSNGSKQIPQNGELCLNCYDGSPYLKIPLTISNPTAETLTVSKIVESAGCSVEGSKTFDIPAGSSVEIIVNIDCAASESSRFITIHSGDSSDGGFTIKLNIAE